MEKRFSIIIPTYNREKFIRRCLDSAISQTMPHRYYEIIVVDDKSTDSTYKILLEYAREHSELIRIYQLQENSGGAATPRNKGIDEARGEYLLFLDSDDTICSDILEKAYNFGTENNSDYIVCKVAIRHKYLKRNVGKVNFMEDNLISPLGGLAKVVKSKSVNEMQIRFDPKYVTGEDQIFNLQCICTFDSISIMADKDYAFTYDDTDNLNHLTKISHGKTYIYYVKRAEHGITIILESHSLTDEEKMRLCGQFLRKHFLYCGLGSFLKKLDKNNMAHQNNFKQLAKFINTKIPCEADKHFSPKLLQALKALRKNDLEALEGLNMHEQTGSTTEIINSNVDDNSMRDQIIEHHEDNANTTRDDYAVGLYYWKRKGLKGNLGDELSPYIVSKLSGSTPGYAPADAPRKICAIGSIINKQTIKSGGIFWGTGTHHSVLPVNDNTQMLDFRAVRGPITRKILLKYGYECPAIYGDPALLMPDFYKPVINKKYKLGIIPHYIHQKHIQCEEDVKFINISRNYNEIENFIDELLECESILSSSLHGIILAHAYGIPARYFKINGVPLNGKEGLKFADYFESVGMPVQEPLIINTGSKISIGYKKYIDKTIDLKIDLGLLKDVFPYRPVEKKTCSMVNKPEFIRTFKSVEIGNLIFVQQNAELQTFFDKKCGQHTRVLLRDLPHYHVLRDNSIADDDNVYVQYLEHSWKVFRQNQNNKQGREKKLHEYSMLLQEIRKDGVKKPIKICKTLDNKILLVDGNHRASIAYHLGLDLPCREISFKTFLRKQINTLCDTERYALKKGMPYQSIFYGENCLIKGRRTDILERFKKFYLQDIRGKNILDLGCNIASTSHLAWFYGANSVTAVEYSPNIARVALRIASALGSKVDIKVHDLGQKLAFPIKFDTIFALSIFLHVKNQEMFVENVLNNLVQGGILYFEGHAKTTKKTYQILFQNFPSIEFIGYNADGIHSKKNTRPLWRLQR